MTQAILYGVISGFSLVVGAFIGIIFKFNQKAIAKFMAFGSGVLICALSFGLMSSAFTHGGFDAIIVGFLLGGITFIIGDYIIHLLGGRKHKRQKHFISNAKINGSTITLGAILDGFPESIALGIAIFSGQGLGFLMLGAIILSNFPEGISSVTGLIKEGFKKWQIITVWIVVAIVCAILTVISYKYLYNLDLNTIGIIEAYAAGAILAMLADTMMPEAYEEGGFSIGLLTVFGFLVAFIISRL